MQTLPHYMMLLAPHVIQPNIPTEHHHTYVLNHIMAKLIKYMQFVFLNPGAGFSPVAMMCVARVFSSLRFYVRLAF